MSIKIDPWDIPGAHGILVIEYQGLTRRWCLWSDNTRNNCYEQETILCSCGRYGMLMDAAPLTKEMQNLKESVNDRKFSEKKHAMGRLQQVHWLQHESKETDREEDGSDEKLARDASAR